MYHNSDYRLQTGCGFIIGLLLIFWVGSGLFSFAKQFYEERQLLPTPITGTIVSYELYRDYEHTVKDIVVEFDYKGKTYTLDSREQVVFTTKTLREEISDDFTEFVVAYFFQAGKKALVVKIDHNKMLLLLIERCSSFKEKLSQPT